MSEYYKPFNAEFGDIRGPFKCGHAGRPDGGVQFAIASPEGWRYVIKPFSLEGIARAEAEEISKQVKEALSKD